MDEQVLKGNAAILKCNIPSFVSDFVVIDAWIDEENGEEFRADMGGQLGSHNYFLLVLKLILFVKYLFTHDLFLLL